MIKHVVFIKFKTGTSDEAISEIETGLVRLKGIIPEILELECGRDILHSERSYDFALILSCNDLDALKRYQIHPDHQAVLEKIKAAAADIKAVDYKY